MKKIAIPTRGEKVDDHFGHCEYYSIYTINQENRIEDKELYEAPKGCGCKSNIAPILSGKGVSLMLAGNMGMGALNVLQAANIEVLRGCKGNVNDVIEKYLNGKLFDSGESCAHHHQHQGHQDHQCENHH